MSESIIHWWKVCNGSGEKNTPDSRAMSIRKVIQSEAVKATRAHALTHTPAHTQKSALETLSVKGRTHAICI